MSKGLTPDQRDTYLRDGFVTPLRAIDAAEAASGGIVYLPAGEYRCDGLLTVNASGVHVQGEGTDKTRLYFTSESHVYTLLNLLRYAHERHPVPKLIDEAGEATLEWASELSYLTQILFYVYEHKEHPVGSPLRFQVQVLFSAGDGLEPANSPANSPKKAPSGESGVERVHSSGAQPLHTLHASLPLADVLNFFDRLSKV